MMRVDITPNEERKKICIVVPVYNAEKFLGFCLNSLVSQTYTNWTAVLVDDGSTDSSLEICRSYEAMDPRFRVITKPNGGVSSARNAGLAVAEGDYLAFLDSDDYLAPETLEKQVKLAEEYNSQLVLMDVMMVDFTAPEQGHVLLSSAWLKKSPCLLSAEEFKEKRMQLVWYTVLLECLHAKLYDFSLWKKLGLTFPEDLSLGEDFVVNMKYFEACNNAVFLHECGHYYNCIQGSGSLAQKYRPNLFENKMFLMEKLEEHLGGRTTLPAPERDAFYCYAASNGLSCVERVILDSGMPREQICRRLQEMLAHPLFAESLLFASYIPDRFAACMDAMKKNDLEYVLDYIANDVFAESAKQQAAADGNEETAAGQEMAIPPKPGLLNRIIRKILRIMIALLGQSPKAERIAWWEREIYLNGLRKTIQWYVYTHKKATKGELLSQTQTLENHFYGVYNRIDERYNSMEQRTSRLARKLEKEFGEKLDNELNAAQAHLRQQMDEKLAASVARIQETTNGDIWFSEERMRKDAYRREINELRQRKKAIMIATAEHSNIGDAAITLAEQQILMDQFPEYFQVEISTYEFAQKEAYLHAILNPGDIIIINGGGNMGDMYPEEEELHRKIVSTFPENKIIIFPQTISFSSTESGMQELEKSKKAYNRHQDLTLLVRGRTSLEFAQTHFDRIRTFLMPDAAHALRTRYAFDRSGALLCMRGDGEGVLDDNARSAIAAAAQTLAGSVTFRTNVHSEDVPRELRGLVVRQELMCFARHQVVVTDRLHGMIFAAITATPCVVLASCNHKLQEYYEAFFRDSNAVFFLGKDMGNLESALQQALTVTDVRHPIFDENQHQNIRELSMRP